MILALRTDQPEAELYLYTGGQEVDSYSWMAHRELSDTLLVKIEQLLASHQLDVSALTGIVVYQGPGSFTGLRIGIATANTLAYTRALPIVGTEGESWLKKGLEKIKNLGGVTGQIVIPTYGAQPNITAPRK
jgi:tRNA threonylcarbamoyladenosine biosynthesis protein TsaB